MLAAMAALTASGQLDEAARVARQFALRASRLAAGQARAEMDDLEARVYADRPDRLLFRRLRRRVDARRGKGGSS